MKELQKELEEKLNEVFHNWIKKYKLEPNCYIVVNDEFIKVKDSPYITSKEEDNQCKQCYNYNIGDGYDDISKCYKCNYYNK